MDGRERRIGRRALAEREERVANGAAGDQPCRFTASTTANQMMIWCCGGPKSGAAMSGGTGGLAQWPGGRIEAKTPC